MFKVKFLQDKKRCASGILAFALLTSVPIWIVHATGTETPTPQPASLTVTPTPNPIPVTVGEGYKGVNDLPPLSLVSSVEGVDQGFAEKGAGPPDVGFACSPSVCLEATRNWYLLIGMDGTIRDKAYSVDLFRSLLLPKSGPSDPRPVYDTVTHTFYLSAFSDQRTCKMGQVCETYFLLAVSDNSDPKSFKTGWSTFRSNASEENGKGTSTVPDFDSMAVADHTVVVTSHVMAPNELNLYEKIRFTLVADVTNSVDLAHFADPSGKIVFGGIQPVIEQDAPSDTPVYFLSVSGCNINVWKVTDPTKPKLEVKTAKASTTCTEPPMAKQLGAGPLSVAGGAVLLSQPVFRNGHIWAVQQVGVGSTAGIRWFEIDVSMWPKLTFIQDARLSNPNEYLNFPALAVDEQENMALIFGQSSSKEHPSLWITGRLATDAPNTVRPPILLHQSPESMDNVESSGGEMGLTENRYGDFFNCSFDFAGGFWCAGEYVKQPQWWGTWAGHVSFPAG